MGNDTIKVIRSRFAELQKILKTAQRALKGAPPGNLRVSKVRDKAYFYKRNDPACGKDVYIPKNNEELIRQLAQKDYWLEVKRAAEKELDYLKTLGVGYPDQAPEDVYDSLDVVRQGLVKPIIESDEDYIRRWNSVVYDGLPYKSGDKAYHTKSGEIVRSKSEATIANELLDANVPYYYEKPLVLSDGTRYYPDFTVLNVRTRSTLWWEHLGMMDDPGYLERTLEKLKKYEENGIFPGEKLILTYETAESTFDSLDAQRQIRHYLQ